MTSERQGRVSRRRAVLFLLGLAAPCAVLAGLGLQVNRQERQLAERRAAEDHQRRLEHFRNELLSALERVKRQAASGDEHTPAALVATVQDGSLVLPSEDNPHAAEFRRALEHSEFGARIREGEREEIIEGRFEEAAARYRSALVAARTPWERAYATLLAGRAERKAGKRGEARSAYRAVLESPPDVRDEYGIPLALYAVEPLLDFAVDRAEAARALAKVALPGLPAAAISMIRDLAVKLKAADLLPQVNRLLREREQAEALEADFPRMISRLQSGDPVWIAYGEPLWLVSLANPQPNGTGVDLSARRSVVVAVSAERALGLLPAGGSGDNSATLAAGKQGEPLGESFPGLHVVLPPEVAPNGTLGRLYFSLALAFVGMLTLISGVLLWRDLSRSERLAEMRSHFISSVSHELRTPLTSIRMFTEAMRLDDEMDPESRAQYLDTVLHESERLSRLVDNVLHFARIEQGRAVYDLRPAALPQIVERTVRSFGPLAEQAGFRLDVRIEPGLPRVAADRDALEQAILNLLGNAMKYSGGFREIALHVEREDPCAAIRVIDRGIGIAPEEQGRIFDRFYRAGPARDSQVPGAGLGLTLVDHIAKAHGGGVSVESQVGAGSTFTIRIPFASESAEAQAAAAGRI